MPTDATRPTDDEVLLPCPKCRSANLCPTVLKSFADEMDWWNVSCHNCYHDGPHKATKAEAITAWNTRTTPQPHIAAEPGEVERFTRIMANMPSPYDDDSLANYRSRFDAWQNALTATEPRAAGEGTLADSGLPAAIANAFAFLSAAAGEGFVIQGIDAADTYTELASAFGFGEDLPYPNEVAAALRQPSTERESVRKEAFEEAARRVREIGDEPPSPGDSGQALARKLAAVVFEDAILELTAQPHPGKEPSDG